MITAPPALQPRPILGMDEIWSFGGTKAHEVWIWVAIDRATRRIAGLAFGDRRA